ALELSPLHSFQIFNEELVPLAQMSAQRQEKLFANVATSIATRTKHSKRLQVNSSTPTITLAKNEKPTLNGPVTTVSANDPLFRLTSISYLTGDNRDHARVMNGLGAISNN